ncbi:hypothetical protein V5799_016696 [Amblyomma americanum]|uniref:BPTI/Kunitz inhibitor domain-containing protein n=1 Tax=Amblyomma americanum TaxID=6943 RepID=A0AAQ4F5G4_AMBAM
MKTPTCFLFALLCLTLVLVQGYKPPRYCQAKPNDGQCGHVRPSIERWYFDGRYGYCGPFLWGGCGGNKNNFPNCTACMTTCTRYKPPRYCKAKPDDGQCGGVRPSIERWYFDVRYGYCGPFLWGGCGGNNNNFPNCTACMTTCTTHPDPEGACRYIINSP